MKPATVKGHHLLSPRLTSWGMFLLLLHIGLPLVGVLLLADVALYLVFTRALGRCYGLLCLVG